MFHLAQLTEQKSKTFNHQSVIVLCVLLTVNEAKTGRAFLMTSIFTLII